MPGAARRRVLGRRDGEEGARSGQHACRHPASVSCSPSGYISSSSRAWSGPATLKLGLFSLKSPAHRVAHAFSKKRPLRVQAFQNIAQRGEAADEEVMRMFLKERQTNGDLITRVSDVLWRRLSVNLVEEEATSVRESLRRADEVVDRESDGGYLKLTTTHEWILGDTDVAPVNKKSASKDWQNDSETRKKLNLLRYEAIKRELLLLTIGIGAGCCVYCLVELSAEAAFSYAAGVLFSCVYLQLLSYHIDNLSSEAIPKIFLQKRSKKIGIRSEDLRDTIEKTFWGSTMALSSPRLVIPAALYGIWILSQRIFPNFDFQIVPAMLGFFAYKAAALVQVYRDNEDLRFIFPDSEEDPSRY